MFLLSKRITTITCSEEQNNSGLTKRLSEFSYRADVQLSKKIYLICSNKNHETFTTKYFLMSFGALMTDRPTK